MPSSQSAVLHTQPSMYTSPSTNVFHSANNKFKLTCQKKEDKDVTIKIPWATKGVERESVTIVYMLQIWNRKIRQQIKKAK